MKEGHIIDFLVVLTYSILIADSFWNSRQSEPGQNVIILIMSMMAILIIAVDRVRFIEMVIMTMIMIMIMMAGVNWQLMKIAVQLVQIGHRVANVSVATSGPEASFVNEPVHGAHATHQVRKELGLFELSLRHDLFDHLTVVGQFSFHENLRLFLRVATLWMSLNKKRQ